MKKILTPIRHVKPTDEKIKDTIKETISLEDEVKILRETVSKLLKIVKLDDKEFNDYCALIEKTKTEVKSKKINKVK